jgi:hypothetical protein
MKRHAIILGCAALLTTGAPSKSEAFFCCLFGMHQQQCCSAPPVCDPCAIPAVNMYAPAGGGCSSPYAAGYSAYYAPSFYPVTSFFGSFNSFAQPCSSCQTGCTSYGGCSSCGIGGCGYGGACSGGGCASGNCASDGSGGPAVPTPGAGANSQPPSTYAEPNPATPAEPMNGYGPPMNRRVVPTQPRNLDARKQSIPVRVSRRPSSAETQQSFVWRAAAQFTHAQSNPAAGKRSAVNVDWTPAETVRR